MYKLDTFDLFRGNKENFSEQDLLKYLESSENNSFKTKQAINVNKKIKKTKLPDRFIPPRNTKTQHLSSFLLANNIKNNNFNDTNDEYKSKEHDLLETALTESLFEDYPKRRAINNYNQNLTSKIAEFFPPISSVAQMNSTRVIPSFPEKILDAPDLLDDYYLNLLDWGNNGLLAVALNKTMYLWNGNTGEIIMLFNAENENESVQNCEFDNNNLIPADRTAVSPLIDTVNSLSLENFDHHSLSPQRYLTDNNTPLSPELNFAINPNLSLTPTNNNFFNEPNYISSVSWMNQDGNILAAGFANGKIQVYDISYRSLLRTIPFSNNFSRVAALSWNCNNFGSNNFLSAGNKNGELAHFDLRIQNPLAFRISNAHTHEICSLKWSLDGKQLASGSNDNLLKIWDLRYNVNVPKLVMNEHSSAVKALAWSPYQNNMLVSGAGTHDKTIKIWKTNVSGRENLISSTQTHSPVSSLIWSSVEKELISGHGNPNNSVIVWKFNNNGFNNNNIHPISELNGHTNRILALGINPESDMLVSAGADETLRFWKIYENLPLMNKKENRMNLLNASNLNLR